MTISKWQQKNHKNWKVSKFLKKSSETNCLSPEDISQNVLINRKIFVIFNKTLKRSLKSEAINYEIDTTLKNAKKSNPEQKRDKMKNKFFF